MSVDQSDPDSSRSLCVLFADVSGSTQLYELLGDERALPIIARCIRHMDAATRLYRGTTVQTIGDEILATFPTAELGIQAAVEMMSRVTAEPHVAGKRLALRIGLHYGPVLRHGSYLFGGHLDVHGDTVNTTARIVALAKSRQILISAETVGRLSQHWRQSSRIVDSFTLKGKSMDMQIAEIFWEQQDRTTFLGLAPPSVRNSAARLALAHLGRRYQLDGIQRRITLGRESGNDIVIDDRRISRQHARIERRRDKFVLIDTSTNGTYVGFEGENELPIRMEEIVLHGRGRISLGQPYDNGDSLVTFVFEAR